MVKARISFPYFFMSLLLQNDGGMAPATPDTPAPAAPAAPEVPVTPVTPSV